MTRLPVFKKRKWIYQGRKLSLALEDFSYGGKTFKREIIHHNGAVVIIPVLGDGKILLIRQYRYPTRSFLWELPAGTRDKNKKGIEPARVCAAREIQEEIGYKAGTLKRLGGFFLAPGTSTEFMDVYLATKLTAKRLQGDEDEIILPRAFSRGQILRMIRSGQIQDAKTIAALFYCGTLSRGRC